MSDAEWHCERVRDSLTFFSRLACSKRASSTFSSSAAVCFAGFSEYLLLADMYKSAEVKVVVGKVEISVDLWWMEDDV